MVTCKSLSILGVAVACLCAVVFNYAGGLHDHVFCEQPAPVPIQPRQDRQKPMTSPKRYGKFELPASISIDLVQGENSGSPVTLMTAVASNIPVRSSTLTLKIPQIDSDPQRTEVLWSTPHSGFVAEAGEYTLGFLPLGRYQVIAFFEFTPDREGTKKRVLSKSLFLDVRPDKILSSNVSFRQIDRLALQRDLDERIFTSLKRDLKTEDRKRVLHELTLLEAGDPAIMRQKIRQLRATEPEVARRMMALNRTHSESMNEISADKKIRPAPAADPESEFVRPPSVSHRGQPASEQAVPIPERLKR